MLFQSSVPALFSQMGASLYSSANTARKQEASKLLDLYQSQALIHLEQRLAELFAEPERFSKITLNVVRKIVNLQAQTYREAPVRKIESGTKADQERYAQIAEECSLDLVLKQSSRFVKLLKSLLLKVVWTGETIRLDIILPHIIEEVETGDSPYDLQQIIIADYGRTERIEDLTYRVWRAESLLILDCRGSVIEEKPNPYAPVLPFVPLFDSFNTSSSFFLPLDDSLISMQESINLKLTDLAFLISMQSFGVGFIKGSQTGASLKVDPGTLVELPETGSIGFVSQQAEIRAVVEAIDTLIKWCVVTQGLSAGSISTDPQEQSGIAKQWDSKELFEMRQDDTALWRGHEKKLFNLIRIVHNAHDPRNKLSETATLRVDFADPTKQSLSAKDQATADDLRLAQGVITSVDLLLRDNADFQGDRDRAMAHLLQLKEETKLLTE